MLKLIRMWRRGELTRVRLPFTLKKLPQGWKLDDLEKFRQFCFKCRDSNDAMILRYINAAMTQDTILDLNGENLNISTTAIRKLRELRARGLI